MRDQDLKAFSEEVKRGFVKALGKDSSFFNPKALLANQELVEFVVNVDNLSEDEVADTEYLVDRIQTHLEEPQVREKFL